MTLIDVIDEIDAIEPNAYTYQQKAKWVLRAEGSVATGIYLMDPEDVSRPTLADDASEEWYFPLLTPAPFDKIYPLYLHAMIHYANSEYERYQNDMMLYNEAYGEFARWFAAKYDPALTKRKRSLRWSITLDPGEASDGDVKLTELQPGDIVGPVRVTWVNGNERNRGSIEVRVPFGNLDEQYLYAGEISTEEPTETAPCAYRSDRAAELMLYYNLESFFMGGPLTTRLEVPVYSYGWPDEWRRRP